MGRFVKGDAVESPKWQNVLHCQYVKARLSPCPGKSQTYFLARYTCKYYYKIMEARKVVWESEKDTLNRKEHDIGFDVAQLVFGDPRRLERIDQNEGNAFGEERWQTLGMAGKVLFVVYTERGETTRLISARLANKAERRSYNGYYHIDGKGWSEAD
jgi:uncharacterized DUF497 family protein